MVRRALILVLTACALLVALVVSLANERFEIINAVLESPRWPLFR